MKGRDAEERGDVFGGGRVCIKINSSDDVPAWYSLSPAVAFESQRWYWSGVKTEIIIMKKKWLLIALLTKAFIKTH